MQDAIFHKMLMLALPYYERGRFGDVEHIKWLFETVPQYIPENLDSKIVLPVVLLHDVGYSKVPKGSDSYNLDIRKLHSEEGAHIAREILTELHYSEEEITEIERLVLKHDNWAFGDSFDTEPVLKFFNNFDFMWMASKPGFAAGLTLFKRTPQSLYNHILECQDINVAQGRNWATPRIEQLYVTLLAERKQEYQL